MWLLVLINRGLWMDEWAQKGSCWWSGEDVRLEGRVKAGQQDESAWTLVGVLDLIENQLIIKVMG